MQQNEELLRHLIALTGIAERIPRNYSMLSGNDAGYSCTGGVISPNLVCNQIFNG
jgi:hypothetical protein